eukprot:532476_1
MFFEVSNISGLDYPVKTDILKQTYSNRHIKRNIFKQTYSNKLEMCSVFNTCGAKCCKCCGGLMIVVMMFILLCMFVAKKMIPDWIEKSNCLPASNCYCPHYTTLVDESPFITFDICVSENQSIDLSNYHSYLKYTITLTRNNISAGEYQTQNITLETSDLFDQHIITDLFAHIIVSDYPKSNKEFAYHSYVKLTTHEFKESVTTKSNIIRRNMNHIVYLQDQLNISYVTQYGCFNRSYHGNQILFPNIHNKGKSYSPISVVLHGFSQQKFDTITHSVPLTVSFNPTTIFGFQLQSLLRMDSNLTVDYQRHAPEMFSAYQLIKSLNLSIDLNSVLSLDELTEVYLEAILIWISWLFTSIIGLLALREDIKYWTDKNLTMKNICATAILIYCIVPVVQVQYGVYASYTGSNDINIVTITQSQESQISQQQLDTNEWMNYQKQFEQYWNSSSPEQVFGIWIAVICGIFVGIVGLGFYIVLPIFKAGKCFILKRKEGVRNDMVAVSELLLVCGISAVVIHDYTLLRYFLKYIGMTIFIPQVFVNYYLDEEYGVPKLPLFVLLLQFLDDSIQSLFSNYSYMDKHCEMTKMDVCFWCRDATILLILYLQFRYHGLSQKQKIE